MSKLYEAVGLSSDIYADNKDLYNRARSMATKAMDFEWPDLVLAACYLHGIYEINPLDYEGCLEKAAEIDTNLAKIIDKFVKKDGESYSSWSRRLSMSPYGKPVGYLYLIEKLSEERDPKMVEEMANNIPRLFPTQNDIEAIFRLSE